jgi:hypothetical protein
LSNLGETLVLIDAAGVTNNTLVYPSQPTDAQRYLVVSELMYQPPGDGLAEFIELYNISPSVTLNLGGIRFTRGVEFDFTGSAVTSLGPGARVLVVRHLAAFQAAYGSNQPVAGVFTNGTALNNTGELVKLEDANSETIREFTYSSAAPWPVAGAQGRSLVLIAPGTNPDHANPTNWQASARAGGNPGWPDGLTFQGDPLADTNRNGQNDYMDFLMGNDLGRDSIFPSVHLHPSGDGTTAEVRLEYPLNLSAQADEPSVMYSTTLTSWQDAAGQLDLVERVNHGDGRELLRWRVKAPLRDEPGVYLRLQAVAPSP